MSLGVTKERASKGDIARDIIFEAQQISARQRTRPMLTSWEVRHRMVDELRERPEEFRQRSLRRRLTKLDRALTDRQAFALDRAFTAWLITAGRSNSVDPTGETVSVVWKDAALPLRGYEFEEVAKFRKVMAAWDSSMRHKLETLFSLMAPWAERRNLKPDEASIRQVVELASLLEKSY